MLLGLLILFKHKKSRRYIFFWFKNINKTSGKPSEKGDHNMCWLLVFNFQILNGSICKIDCALEFSDIRKWIKTKMQLKNKYLSFKAISLDVCVKHKMKVESNAKYIK